MRAVAEWAGRTDDAAIPARVQVRVFGRCNGRCRECTRKCGVGGEPFQIDHTVALINGGEHEESNLQLLCVDCHKRKTKLDVKLKAKVARVRKRHLGIRKPSRFAGSRDSKWKKKINGEVVAR